VFLDVAYAKMKTTVFTLRWKKSNFVRQLKHAAHCTQYTAQ